MELPVAFIVALLLIATLLVAAFLLVRRRGEELTPRLEAIERSSERVERSVRDEISRLRESLEDAARQDREEIRGGLQQVGTQLRVANEDRARTQHEHLELFGAQVGSLASGNQQLFQNLRDSIERRVLALQEDNARQLGEMRLIVEEKLQGALEKRLGESFSQVSQQLEQVYKGLGEMQTLATGVGDLKRVLSNVKARGGWGEVMLGTLLSDTLSPDQYQQNVRTKAESKEVVEFVIRLPGRGTYDQPVLLPVDSKFPLEDYERLMRAQESLDQAGMEESSKALEQRIKQFAKDIRDKYLDPPQTTDFGVMFIPSEGLYAEVVRRGPLVETLRREFQVVVAGPSTFSALLNSLQMGFRTLAIEKRSSEVWQLLGAVKTEFGRFGTVLDQVKKKLDEASSTMEKAAQRSRAIERKLRQVEVLPSEQAAALLESPTNELLSESGDDSAALP